MKSYKNKIVVVTGAGSGMGRAYALEAAARGARLALNDYDEAALAQTEALLPTGTEVLSAAFDVAKRAAVYSFAASVHQTLGAADVVINNAGIEGSGKPGWAWEDEELQRVLDINFWGVVHGTRAFLPQLLEDNRSTALVNVSSLFGLLGSPNQADYCAAKFAVRGFTEALSVELVKTNLRVHLVHPGGIATNIARHDRGQGFATKYLKTSPEAIAKLVLDTAGTGRGRIVDGHRAGLTYWGVRTLPQRLMARLVWRDMAPVLDQTFYPPNEHAGRHR